MMFSGSMKINLRMIKMKNYKNNTNLKKGQALLFVLVAVSIALAVGVTVSTRNLSSISRTSRSDTSARAYAAAEGGVERLLKLTEKKRDDLSKCGGSCDAQCTSAGFLPNPSDHSECLVNFDTPSGETLLSRARVRVQEFYFNAANYYYFELNNGFTKEIVLENPDGQKYQCPATPAACYIRVCWTNNNATLFYYSYNSTGQVYKSALKPAAGGTHAWTNNISSYGWQEEGSSMTNYPNCQNIRLVPNAYGLRIRALFDNTTVAVLPVSPASILPHQGYQLVSVGELTEESRVKESKVVRVYKSLNYMPSIFDYALYTTGSL